MLIFETKNFIITTPEKPEVSREDGGQVDICEKHGIEDRLMLSPKAELELAYLTHVVAQAFITVMRKNGVPVERLNYQDNGNWCYIENKKPHQHLHIYGRVFASKKQPLPMSLYFPHPNDDFYKDNKPLTEKDINDIRSEIERLMQTERYNKTIWHLEDLK